MINNLNKYFIRFTHFFMIIEIFCITLEYSFLNQVLFIYLNKIFTHRWNW